VNAAGPSLADLIRGSAPPPSSSPGPVSPKSSPTAGGRGAGRAAGPAKTGGMPSLSYSLQGPENGVKNAISEFKLTCKDPHNQVYELDIGLIEAKIWIPGNQNSERQAVIKRQNRGVFIIQCQPVVSGNHHFNIWIHSGATKRALYDSAVMLNVLEGKPTEAENLSFSLAGKSFLGAEVGSTTFFEIIVTGNGGRPADINTDKLVVAIESRFGGRQKAYCERIGVGRYKSEFVPGSAGANTVRLTYDGVDVCSQAINFDTGIDPAKCCIVNAPRNVDVGAQTTFVIDSKSGLGLKIPRGGEKFEVGVDGPDNGVNGLVIRDESTGSYAVRFRLVVPGRYQFFVSLHKIPVSGSPFVVNAS